MTTTKEEDDEISTCCLICANDFSNVNHHRKAIHLSCCCNQKICQDCLYLHIQSILEEGLSGQGRNNLDCPMGCGRQLSETLIRTTFQRQNPVTWPYRVGFLLLYYCFKSWLLEWRNNNPFNTCAYHEIYMYLVYSSQAARDLSRYHQWSLAVAFRGNQSTLLRCPAPDCNYTWFAGERYRRSKRQHENRPSYLWYSPPKPERVGNYDWVEPEYVNLGSSHGTFLELDDTDGRRIVCAKCLTAFCGLCRRPWESGPRYNHAGLSCRSYGRRIPDDDVDYAFIAQMTDARSCPNCSMRIIRSDGCNHMTCPCGQEWCYVCECRWNPRHYGCREIDRRRRRQSRTVCTIM